MKHWTMGLEFGEGWCYVTGRQTLFNNFEPQWRYGLMRYEARVSQRLTPRTGRFWADMAGLLSRLFCQCSKSPRRLTTQYSMHTQVYDLQAS